MADDGWGPISGESVATPPKPAQGDGWGAVSGTETNSQDGVISRGLGIAKEAGLGFARGAERAMGEVGEAVSGPFSPISRSVWNMSTAPEPTPEDIAKHGSRANYFRSFMQPSYGQQLVEKTGTQSQAQPGTPEAYAGRAGEVLGHPLSYVGPGGLASKVIGGIGSGVGAEAGKEYFGTPGEIIGGVLGGAGAGKLAATAENMVRGVPTTDQVLQAARNQFDQARQVGVTYDPNAVDSLYTNIYNDLWGRGHRPSANSAGGTFARIEEFRPQHPANAASPLQPVPSSYADIESVRRALSEISRERRPNPPFQATPDAAAAHQAIDHIDTFLSDPANVIAGDAQLATQLHRTAASNYRSGLNSQGIEAAAEKGERGAAGTGSGANIDNRLRQQMTQIMNNPRRRAFFNGEEQGMIDQIIHGSVPRNAVRLIGKMAVTGVVSAAGIQYLASQLGFGSVGHLLLPAAGYAAKKAGDFSTRSAINQLSESIRAESPLGQSMNIAPRQTAMPAAVRGGLNAASTVTSDEQPLFAHGGTVKVSKASAHYRTGSTAKHCSICSMFVKPQGCTAVKGVIRPRGLCDLFEKKD